MMLLRRRRRASVGAELGPPTRRGGETTLTALVSVFWRDKLALAGLVILVAFVLIALFAPSLAPYDTREIHRNELGRVRVLEPPSWQHPFGTTNLGRDVFSMTIMGTRIALLVGFLAAFLVTVIGTLLGLVSGYYGGWIDTIIMRTVDVLYAIPLLPAVLILIVVLGPNFWNFILAVTLLTWRGTARIIRSQVLSIRERPFVKSGITTGASTPRILFRYIAPNIMPLVLLEMALSVGWVIVTEASLSFIGFGDPRLMSWGQVLHMAFLTGSARVAWWWILPPGIAITLVVMAAFFAARALEEVANPRLRLR
jgi:peptide/nickel transport system permease protein